MVLNRQTACQQTPSAVSVDMPLLAKWLDVLRHCCVGGAGLYLPTFEDTSSRQWQLLPLLWTVWWRTWFLRGARDFSLPQSIQTSSMTPLPPASYSVGTVGSFPMCKAAGARSRLYTFMVCNSKTSPLLWDNLLLGIRQIIISACLTKTTFLVSFWSIACPLTYFVEGPRYFDRAKVA